MKIKVEYNKGIEDVLSELKIDSIKPGDVRVYSSLDGLTKGLPKGLTPLVIENGITEFNKNLEITSFGIKANYGRVPNLGTSFIRYIGKATVIRE